METQFTPGPWNLKINGKRKLGITSSCPVAWDIANVDADVNMVIDNVTRQLISIQSVANAHLIAAAPDMFEVIKELYEYSMNTGHKGVLFPKIEAAYLKATGQHSPVNHH